MSLVEATTRPQTSTFAFTPRLETTKSAQLATITSCAYLSQKCISRTIKMPGGLQLKERFEATNPSAKNKSVYYTIKTKGADDSKSKSTTRNLRLSTPKSSEQDCKGGGRRFRTILQPSPKTSSHQKKTLQRKEEDALEKAPEKQVLGRGRRSQKEKLLSPQRSH